MNQGGASLRPWFKSPTEHGFSGALDPMSRNLGYTAGCKSVKNFAAPERRISLRSYGRQYYQRLIRSVVDRFRISSNRSTDRIRRGSDDGNCRVESDENGSAYEIHSTTYQTMSAMVGSVTANFRLAMRLTSRM